MPASRHREITRVIDLWYVTPTANIFEIGDLYVALFGIVFSSVNLIVARRRAHEWRVAGGDRAVQIAADTTVRHESLRVGTNICFFFIAGFLLRWPSTPTVELVAFHASLLAAMALTLIGSISSMRSRRRIEHIARRGWDGVERRRTVLTIVAPPAKGDERDQT